MIEGGQPVVPAKPASAQLQMQKWWEETEIAGVHHIYLCILQLGQTVELEGTAPSLQGSCFLSKDRWLGGQHPAAWQRLQQHFQLHPQNCKIKEKTKNTIMSATDSCSNP